MFGIKPPFQGFIGFLVRSPRALPWATIGCPFGAEDRDTSANGATYRSLGQLGNNALEILHFRIKIMKIRITNFFRNTTEAFLDLG